eukprot:431357-Karenia_brevis.AAC.1
MQATTSLLEGATVAFNKGLPGVWNSVGGLLHRSHTLPKNDIEGEQFTLEIDDAIQAINIVQRNILTPISIDLGCVAAANEDVYVDYQKLMQRRTEFFAKISAGLAVVAKCSVDLSDKRASDFGKAMTEGTESLGILGVHAYQTFINAGKQAVARLVQRSAQDVFKPVLKFVKYLSKLQDAAGEIMMDVSKFNEKACGVD